MKNALNKIVDLIIKGPLGFVKKTDSGYKMKDSRSIGKHGEEIASKALEKNKYRILERNFRCRQGEIDIIAEDKDGVLCFIEVKSRSSDAFGRPEEVVNSHKQRRLTAAAYVYLEKNRLELRDMRFDIVSVNLNSAQCDIIKSAFEVGY